MLYQPNLNKDVYVYIFQRVHDLHVYMLLLEVEGDSELELLNDHLQQGLVFQGWPAWISQYLVILKIVFVLIFVTKHAVWCSISSFDMSFLV